MTPNQSSADRSFHWETQPDAAKFFEGLLNRLKGNSDFLLNLEQRMLDDTGTLLLDWIDHLEVPGEFQEELEQHQFSKQAWGEQVAWQNHLGLFPPISLADSSRHRVAIKVDSMVDFLSAHNLQTQIKGAPGSPLRMAMVDRKENVEIWVVERHGLLGWEAPVMNTHQLKSVLLHQERFRLRRRSFKNCLDGFAHAHELIDDSIRELGVDQTCSRFFEAERQYWGKRNRAARIQLARQNALGLGWANHDHHTFRCSRVLFAPLIAVLEKMGFRCRERFYAGREAGWGAQVIEQPQAGITIFADVDLLEEEVSADFAHCGLSSQDQLGTIGLWCQLHGEAFLQAGMHHLECQFDFDRVVRQLDDEGIQTMDPFTDFHFLKQAFTVGERWPVDPNRIAAALEKRLVSPEQAERFTNEDAVGSHLEILQRRQGYKGFNQTGISSIIKKTDPREL